jgi:hypothetical protein
MERKCSQSIKIPFPIKVFYGTDVIINLPRSGNMIKNIRLVMDFDTNNNTLGERILEKADFLSGDDDEILETVYGEFIHVENNFKVPIEKTDTLDELLCTTSPGRFYMKIPFQCTSVDDGFFIFEKNTPKVRLLFNNLNENIELKNAFLMVDYYVTENVPKTPYVQKIKQVQRFSSVVANGTTSVNMHVYAVGSVYELFFTVKDVSTGEYVDAINNITLFFGEKERFNLSGYYLRYIEPMKRYGTHLTEPMYMYSFCNSPHVTNIPSGSTHFHENSFFKIDLFENESTYEITIWAQSHNFVYQHREKSSKLMFKSTEMLLDTTTTSSNSTIGGVPLRVSYSDFAGSATVYYSSPCEISNVLVITDAPSTYTIFQDSIIFQKIDSLFTEYTANVTFSSQGFSDTTCYFKFRGSAIYLDKMVYSSIGNWPTHIDQGQNFHYVLGNTFDTSNIVFTKTNIQTLTIDENKNYSFTTYVPSSVTTNGFTGPGSIVTAYDQNMNSILYTITSPNSNVCETVSNVFGFYGYNISVNGFSTVPTLHQGVILNKDTGTVNYFNAGPTSKVYVDNLDVVSTYIVASIRFESSSINLVAPGTVSTSFGNGSARTALVRISNGVPSFMSVLSSANMNPKTDIHVNREGKCVWAYAYTSASILSSPPNTYSTSGGYSIGKFDILTGSREWNVNVACTPSTIDMKLVVGTTLENVYIVAGYTDATTPTLTGFTFRNGNGFMVLKINNAGVVKFALSFIGSSVTEINPILDSVTGKFMLSVKSSSSGELLKMYNNGVEKYSDCGLYQFFMFDDFGNINSTDVDLNQYFSIPKPLYFLPQNTSNYFIEPQENPPAYTYWNSLVTGPGNEYLRSVSVDANNDIYYSYGLNNYSNIFDKYGDTLVRIPAGSSTVLTKMYSNCVFSGYFVRFTNTLINTNYARVSTGHIYVMCTTNSSGTTRLYDKNNTELFSFAPTSETILVVRFSVTTGVFDNSWSVRIPASESSKLHLDSANNLYITGIKKTTAKSDIFVNGVDFGDIPETLSSIHTAFVIKINSNGVYAWNSYVQNTPYINYVSRVSVATDSSLNVYLSYHKSKSIANINGGATNIPATNALSPFVVKFNPSGEYASWYTHIDSTETDDNSVSSDVKITSLGEVALATTLGVFGPRNSIFNIYVNGTASPLTTTKIKEVCGTLFKYDKDGNYQWNVRLGVAPSLGGNSTFLNSMAIDDSNNFILTYRKQPYLTSVYDRYGNSGGTIPSGLEDNGVILKVNSNGTYSNNYGLVDTLWNDSNQEVVIDTYGNIVFSMDGGNSASKVLYINDKNGFVTSKDTKDISGFSALLKFNANFTCNKISL